MTDHGFGGGRLTDNRGESVVGIKREGVIQKIVKLKDVAWCHVVLADTMNYKAGDLLWEAKRGVDTQKFKDKIAKCADPYQIEFRPSIILEEESFHDERAKHP